MKTSGDLLPPPPRDPGRLLARRHDVLIVGGGINGAGIARDLSLRGLHVALLEKKDFASGTSSASTKLVHGGLRYLEGFDLRLVFESCRERRILQRIAPHLVRPLPFLIPIYRGGRRSVGTVRAGLALYDSLALFRNTGRHHILSAEEALGREPTLRPEGLLAAALYWDCRMDDARLCLENVLAAREAGAEVFNYMEVVGFLRRGERICGVRALDRESGGELEVEAAVVVNASGPWLDRVCALAGETGTKLRTTRGSHILVPRLSGEEALYLTAGSDDRLFFVIPWGELSLIGTTDTDDSTDPDVLAPTEDDIAYLLGETHRYLRGNAPARCDVVSSFAGLRPLVAAPQAEASRVSREHRISSSPSGLISVAGGKYTTYRAVSAEVARLVTDRLGRGKGESTTARIPLPGGREGDLASLRERHLLRLTQEYGVASHQMELLLGRYGSRTQEMLATCREDPSLLRPVSQGSTLLTAEVRYAALYEMARTPEDVLRRRTSRALEPGRGLCDLEGVIRILGECLGASEEVRRRWQHDYFDRYSHT